MAYIVQPLFVGWYEDFLAPGALRLFLSLTSYPALLPNFFLFHPRKHYTAFFCMYCFSGSVSDSQSHQSGLLCSAVSVARRHAFHFCSPGTRGNTCAVLDANITNVRCGIFWNMHNLLCMSGAALLTVVQCTICINRSRTTRLINFMWGSLRLTPIK